MKLQHRWDEFSFYSQLDQVCPKKVVLTCVNFYNVDFLIHLGKKSRVMKGDRRPRILSEARLNLIFVLNL